MPISFVDRAAGESKMSSFIVFEALGLVTWWGLGRFLRGTRRMTTGGGRGKSSSGQAGGGTGAGAVADPTAAPTGTEDPVRSV